MPCLRPAASDDHVAIAEIAYATAFFGNSADRFFPDQRLFADLWVRPYLDPYGPGCCNLVCEDDGRVDGYVLACRDLRLLRRYLLLRLAPHLLRQLLSGTYLRLGGCLPYLLRLLLHPVQFASLPAYPAQLHINLAATARGKGWGEALLRAHLDCLQALGVPGVQLSTTRENEAAVSLYRKLGFEVVAAYPSRLWRPWLGGETVHLVMARKL